MADDGGICIALDVCPPFPACSVWMSGADVFGLEPFKLLLVAEFVGLDEMLAVEVECVKGGRTIS